jgi:hypothetical protein
MENLGQDSWSPGRDLNPGPSKYETGVLTTQLQCPVSHYELFKRRWCLCNEINLKIHKLQT